MAGRPFGVLGRFAGPGELLAACEAVRDAGYRRWDAHTPFPVHGLDRAMGLRPSVLPRIVFVMGFSGAGAAFLFQTWVHTTAYPLVISGKPFFAWPAFVPVTFEVGVLCGALGAVLGMLGLNQLPRHHHPLFNSSAFEQATNDGFFISVEADDPLFDADATERLLRQAGADKVELVDA
jgi:hypothetical protein